MAQKTDCIAITRSTPEKEVLELGSQCSQCGHCCRYGSGFVLKHEIKAMADLKGISEKKFRNEYLKEVRMFDTLMLRFRKIQQENRPYGRCVFLDKENRCSIQEAKPLHCRIGNCSEHSQELSIWFMLNHAVDETNPNSIREWGIYLKTHPTIPGGNLEELVPDKEQLKKMMDDHHTKEVDKDGRDKRS
ncbi:hypothetical protein GF351_05850 [Candidatus Woesearchaeota archaeon]|nr:hypothetical protein [Candidatus Woesearchaeota archaeon]